MADLSDLFSKLEKDYGFPDGKFVKDGQYEILAEHSDSRLKPYASVPADHDGYNTYLAKNTQNGECVLLRIHGSATSSLEETENELEILKLLHDIPEANKFVLIPIETFWHETPKGRYSCWILEMIGPDFQYAAEYTGPEDDNVYPAAMVWKFAKEALEALAFLHSHNICHGYLQKASLVLTYPHLNTATTDAVMSFFGQPSNLGGLQELNETSTDKKGQPMRLDFRLKLTRLVKAFPTSAHPHNRAETYIHINAPPPELLFDHKIQPSVDIWDLAFILTDLFSAYYEYSTLLSSPSSSSPSPLKKLLSTRKYLNQLPARYLSKIPHGQHHFGAYDKNALYTALTQQPFSSETQAFSDDEFEILVRLLRRMLRYEADERWTAEDVLGDEFFSEERPVRGGI